MKPSTTSAERIICDCCRAEVELGVGCTLGHGWALCPACSGYPPGTLARAAHDALVACEQLADRMTAVYREAFRRAFGERRR